jgi:hypothetical protein
MDSTKQEILRKHLKQTESEFQDLGKKNTLDAMEEFAEQEAKAFANWIQYQDIGRKTTDKLWKEFREQVS